MVHTLPLPPGVRGQDQDRGSMTDNAFRSHIDRLKTAADPLRVAVALGMIGRVRHY